jgi:hypothetical protein
MALIPMFWGRAAMVGYMEGSDFFFGRKREEVKQAEGTQREKSNKRMKKEEEVKGRERQSNKYKKAWKVEQ